MSHLQHFPWIFSQKDHRKHLGKWAFVWPQRHGLVDSFRMIFSFVKCIGWILKGEPAVQFSPGESSHAFCHGGSINEPLVFFFDGWMGSRTSRAASTLSTCPLISKISLTGWSFFFRKKIPWVFCWWLCLAKLQVEKDISWVCWNWNY